jgi:hypothetical protein
MGLSSIDDIQEKNPPDFPLDELLQSAFLCTYCIFMRKIFGNARSE